MQEAYSDTLVPPWWAKMEVYWLGNQVSITFNSDLPLSTGKNAIIDSLYLKEFNAFLKARGFQLKPLNWDDVPYSLSKNTSANDVPGKQPEDDVHSTSSGYEDDEQLNSPIGKYVFSAPGGRGSFIVSFFRFEQIAGYMGSASYTADDGLNAVRTIVNLINNNRETLRQEARIPLIVATPNWLSGSVDAGCLTHGCPVIPPIPVTDDCSSWHIALPDLSPNMQRRTGAGVRVFVLDTRPQFTQITEAAQKAGNNNLLLQTIVAQINGQEPLILFNDPDQSLPAVLEDGSEMQPATGRDIYGRLFGFTMADHGLSITGIIRDLAPGATIEYIRVLNNSGAGTIAVLIQTLEKIQHRMLPINPETGVAGDLYHQPIVINLSMVSVAREEELDPSWSGPSSSGPVINNIESLVDPLQLVIQGLTSLGAIVVAAAGNDADERQAASPTMHVFSKPVGPRYPAAFPEVISVGAVDSAGHAAAYSNYPVAPLSAQHNGIATFGGGIPMPLPSQSVHSNVDPTESAPFGADRMTGVDPNTIDALVGIFTDSDYPALSADDESYEYQAPNAYAWAYWLGTSFATPIISAVAARVLEDLVATSSLQPHQWHSEVMRAFTTDVGQQERLTGGEPLPLQPEFSEGTGGSIGLLRAKQVRSVAGEVPRCA